MYRPDLVRLNYIAGAYDAEQIINPKKARSQTIGGIIRGVGQACGSNRRSGGGRVCKPQLLREPCANECVRNSMFHFLTNSTIEQVQTPER
jgi:hypothetical protein